MARDYDSQLLESVAVRRRRLRDALLFGPQRTRRTFDENVGKIIAGLCVAAVLCAGTVGWSYLQSVLQKQEREKAAQEQQSTGGGIAPVPAGWVGAQVTFEQLRAALTKAGVPASLYAVPDKPPAPGVSSYYVIAQSQDKFTGGVVEFQQGRIAAEFPTEDEAARWLYAELVVPTSPPYKLDAQAEQKAIKDGAALNAQVRSEIAKAGGGAKTHTLHRGTLIDRFGQESGSVLFPFGIGFGARGQPASVRSNAVPGVPSSYFRYRVLKAFKVSASISAPAAGSPGGGVRFTIEPGLFPRPPALPTVRWLLRNGYLERVSGTVVPR